MSYPVSEANTTDSPSRLKYAEDSNVAPNDRVHEKEKITFRVILLCLLASVGGLVFGYDTGEISGLLAMPDFIARFGSNGAFSNVREGLIVGLLSIGSLIGCVTAGPLANSRAIGRRGTIMIACVIFIIGTLIQIASISSWVQLMIGRLIAGVGVGQLSVIVPV